MNYSHEVESMCTVQKAQTMDLLLFRKKEDG